MTLSSLLAMFPDTPEVQKVVKNMYNRYGYKDAKKKLLEKFEPIKVLTEVEKIQEIQKKYPDISTSQAQKYLDDAVHNLDNAIERIEKDRNLKKLQEKRIVQSEPEKPEQLLNNNSIYDFHGNSVRQAFNFLNDALAQLQEHKHPDDFRFKLIVGQGNHSEDKIAHIRNCFETMCHNKNVKCERERNNPGVLYVYPYQVEYVEDDTVLDMDECFELDDTSYPRLL